MKSKTIALLASSVMAICTHAADNAIAVSSAQLHKGNAKVDVLGRHNPNVRNTTPIVYAKKSLKDKPMLAKQYSVPNYPYQSTEPRINTFSGEYSNLKNANNNQFTETYKWCGSTKTKTEYAQTTRTFESGRRVREYYAAGTMEGLTGFNGSTDKRKVGPDIYLNQSTYTQNYMDGPQTANIGNIDDENSLRNIAISHSKTGKDIGIYVQQKAIPSDGLGLQFEQLNGCNGSRGTINMYREMYYASEPIRILNSASAKAKVYVMDSDCGEYGSITNLRSGARQPNNPQTKNNNYSVPLYVGLHTNGRGTDYNYNLIAQDIDDYVYFNGVVQIAAAGNTSGENSFISDYAKGANVISVGAIKPVHYGSSYLTNSDWNNTILTSSLKMEKPEIANISNIYLKSAKGGLFTDGINQRYRFDFPAVTGTEGAATLTAAQVVDLMDTIPFYKWHPEVIKALLISASTYEISGGSSYDNDRMSYYDVATKYPTLKSMVRGNRSRFWVGNNADHFSSEKITFQETGIVDGRKYRIAIAWTSRGKFIKEKNKLPQDIDLKVCQGSKCETSRSSANPFEVVNFTASGTAPITIEIERYRNDGGYVILGYNMHETY